MKQLLDDTEVTKVSANHERTHIRIYLHAERLIFRKNIIKLEQLIEKQLFQNKNVKVKIIEKYHLSSLYTPEKLMDVYKDSMLEELNEYSVLEYNLLRTAKMDFDAPSHMILTLENTIIAQTRKEEVLEFLEKVICERCGLNLVIQTEFEEPKESKYRKNSEKQIQLEVESIMERTGIALKERSSDAVAETKEDEQKAEPATQSVKPEKTPQKHEQKKPAYEKKGEFRKKFERDSYKKSTNPDVIYGRDFEEEPMDIDKIDGPIGEVVIRGQILTLETREIRNEKTIVIFSLTDFTDTIVLKVFSKNEDLPELLEAIKKGSFIKVKGVATIDKFDSDLTIGSIVGIKKITDFTSVRMDTSPEKRVELHCHTKMSDMDGVSDVKDIVKRAMKWGHKAIAITDHGDVQAFPDANHAVEGCDSDFKVIYGVEAYLVDDLKDIIQNSHDQTLDDDYVVFDLETTGFSPDVNKIIEIGAVKVQKGKITDRFSTFVNPQVPIPFNIEKLTSINDEMVISAPVIEDILPEFMEFSKDCVMVAHNADFDMSFIKKNCERIGIPCDPTIVDTVALARVLLPKLNRFKLDTVAKALNDRS